MTNDHAGGPPPGRAERICFGLDRQTDEQSLVEFVQRVAQGPLLTTLAARMDEAEIVAALDFLTQLMQKHLSAKEYHTLFLSEREP